jgi:predicted Holliday junction resolvase-like endonuclease
MFFLLTTVTTNSHFLRLEFIGYFVISLLIAVLILSGICLTFLIANRVMAKKINENFKKRYSDLMQTVQQAPGNRNNNNNQSRAKGGNQRGGNQSTTINVGESTPQAKATTPPEFEYVLYEKLADVRRKLEIQVEDMEEALDMERARNHQLNATLNLMLNNLTLPTNEQAKFTAPEFETNPGWGGPQPRT